MPTIFAALAVLLTVSCSPADPQTPEEEQAIEEQRERLLDEMEERKRFRERDRSLYRY